MIVDGEIALDQIKRILSIEGNHLVLIEAVINASEIKWQSFDDFVWVQHKEILVKSGEDIFRAECLTCANGAPKDFYFNFRYWSLESMIKDGALWMDKVI